MELRNPFRAWMLALAFALPAAASAETGVADNAVLIGQTLAMSGPLGEFGRDIVNGARAQIERVNAAGGVNGRKLQLVSLDDQYKTDVAVQNLQRLVQQDKVFALLSVMGTAGSLEAAKLSEAEQLPLVAPWTGVQAVREPARRHVFNVRASYRDEITKIVTHLRTIGTQKVAVVYFESSFGAELATILDQMGRWPAKPVAVHAVQPDGGNVAAVAKQVAAAQPQAIIMLTAGKASVDFIKTYNGLARGVQYYALSVMGTNQSVQALGKEGTGVVVTSVVPFPWDAGVPVVKEYQDAMQKIGVAEYSFTSLESYINTRVLVEAIRRAGKDLTRARLVAAAESMRPLQLGGFQVGYGPGDRAGSSHVDLNIISSSGRFMK
jgi:ABC-type branched-subunit amino acid transport system substrate-binding protein